MGVILLLLSVAVIYTLLLHGANRHKAARLRQQHTGEYEQSLYIRRPVQR